MGLKEREESNKFEDCNILNYVDESEFSLHNHVERMYKQECLNTFLRMLIGVEFIFF